ncbi:hypothetical protein Vspart_01442 [Vibrio spartinae]|uniref:Lipoprotein n=2 Tax=Vibrio spartinae TaxID=1918945 RepID=A0ABX6QZ50_9VIBR|nr:hypothetical protein Vspart_01442 [Vibrio spartinae]
MKCIISFLLFMVSYSCWSYPMKDIYNHLDVTSFNSSLMPMRVGNEKHFSDFELLKAKINDNNITIDDDSWTYSITVLKKNKMGFYACFVDKAKQGSYNTQFPLILRKYGNDYVAIAMRTDVCESFAK